MTFCDAGVATPPLGLGLAALGRPGYINLGHDADLPSKTVDEMRKQAFAVLDAAWQSGVRYFDAARSYGRSEEFLHAWIAARGIEPAHVVVGSKWGYTYTAGWRVDNGKECHPSCLIMDTTRTRYTRGGSSHFNFTHPRTATIRSLHHS